jgi:glycosyltransferase involved in cell wall biosynthesis
MSEIYHNLRAEEFFVISVIVPIYNVETYLPAFLSSLTSQTYKQLEIILIDDGSTDHCYSIYEEWCIRDKRILVFHIPNGGVSAARNYGLQHATGEYIAFADADDLLHPNMYQLLYHAMAKNDADLAICYEVSFLNNQVPDIQPIETYTISEVTDYLGTFHHFLDSFTGYIGWSCNKLYAKSLLAGISFPADINYLEDIHFNLDVSLNVKKCVWIKEKLYLYRQHSANSMKTSSPKKYIDYSKVLVYQLEKASNLGDLILCRHFEYIVNKLMSLYVQAYCDNQKKAARYILLKCKEVRKLYPDCTPELSTILKMTLKRFFPKLYRKRMKYV